MNRELFVLELSLLMKLTAKASVEGIIDFPSKAAAYRDVDAILPLSLIATALHPLISSAAIIVC